MNKYFDTFYDWWKNIDKTIFLIISLLFSLGLFFSLVSTSIIASDKLNTNSYYFFLKHLIFVLIGIFLILFLSLLDQKILIRLSVVLFVITFISLFLVPKFLPNDSGDFVERNKVEWRSKGQRDG